MSKLGDSIQGIANRFSIPGGWYKRLLAYVFGVFEEAEKTNDFLHDMQSEMESQGVVLERMGNALDQIESHLEAIRRIAERTP